jgi:hypothetical protein
MLNADNAMMRHTSVIKLLFNAESDKKIHKLFFIVERQTMQSVVELIMG